MTEKIGDGLTDIKSKIPLRKDIPIVTGVLPVQGEKEAVNLRLQELSGPSGGVFIVEVPNLNDDAVISLEEAKALLNKGAIALQERILKGSEFTQLVVFDTVPFEDVQTDEPYRLIALSTRPADNQQVDPTVIEKFIEMQPDLTGMQVTSLGDREQVTIPADTDKTSPFFTKLETAKSMQTLYRLLEAIHGEPKNRHPYRIDTSDPTRNAWRIAKNWKEFSVSVAPAHVVSQEDDLPGHEDDIRHVIESVHAINFIDLPDEVREHIEVADAIRLSEPFTLHNGDKLEVIVDSDGIGTVMRYRDDHVSGNVLSEFWIVDMNSKKAMSFSGFSKTEQARGTRAAEITMLHTPASLRIDADYYLTKRGIAFVASPLSKAAGGKLHSIFNGNELRLLDRFVNLANIGTAYQLTPVGTNFMNPLSELASRSPAVERVLRAVPGLGRKIDTAMAVKTEITQNSSNFALQVAMLLKEQGLDLFRGTDETEVRKLLDRMNS